MLVLFQAARKRAQGRPSISRISRCNRDITNAPGITRSALNFPAFFYNLRWLLNFLFYGTKSGRNQGFKYLRLHNFYYFKNVSFLILIHSAAPTW